MSLGFKIGVDSSEASRAKKELADLNKSMGALGQSKPIDFGAGLEGASEALKEINQQVKHLQSIAKSGERQKGLLRVDQFKEASRVSKEIKGTFDSYYKSLSSAEQQLDRLISKRRKLITLRDEAKGFTTKRGITDDITNVSKEIKSLTGQLDKRFKIESRLGRSAQQATGRIGGMQQVGGPGGIMGGLGGGLKKAGLIGLGLAGGFTALGFVKEAMAKEIQFAGVESNLLMRGGKVKRKGSYGYTPIQAAQQADIINKATGLGGDELNYLVKNVKMFARGRGASGGKVGEYVSEVYQATGAGALEFKKLFKELTYSVKKGGAEGRIEEFLQINKQVITQMSKGVGGAELSPKTLSIITDFQTRLWESGGEMGRGASAGQLQSSISQGIRGGGKTPGQQMFMLNALTGGEGVQNFSDYYDYMGLREQGMWGVGKTGKTNIEASLEYSSNRWGTDEKGQLADVGRMNLKKMWDLTNTQVDLISKMYSEGGFKDLGKAREEIDTVDLKKDADKFMATTGGRHSEIKARYDTLQLKLGKEVVPTLDKFKISLLDAEGRVEDFLNPRGGRARQLYGHGLEKTSQTELEEKGRQFDVMGGGYAVKREIDVRKRKEGIVETEFPDMVGLDQLLTGNKEGVSLSEAAASFEEALKNINIGISLQPETQRHIDAVVLDKGADF